MATVASVAAPVGVTGEFTEGVEAVAIDGDSGGAKSADVELEASGADGVAPAFRMGWTILLSRTWTRRPPGLLPAHVPPFNWVKALARCQPNSRRRHAAGAPASEAVRQTK